MKKYLFYTENHYFGGGNRYAFDLMNGLIASHNQIVFYHNKKGLFFDDINKINTNITVKNIKVFSTHIFNYFVCKNKNINRFLYLLRLLCEPIFILINIPYFFYILHKEKPNQAIICNGGYPAALSCLSMVFAAKLANIPAMLSVVSVPAPRKKYSYEALMDYCVWNSVDTVITNCQSIKDCLHSIRKCPLSKIEIIFNGIDDSYKGSFTASSGLFTIGCISRIDISKGVFDIIEAFKEIKKRYPLVRLKLVGKGDASTDLAIKIQEYSLEKDVDLMGHYEGDIADILKEIDIFVLPSFWEGLPYAILEAMSHQKIIVATQVGGIPEAIQNGVSGILIPPQRPDMLFTALSKLLDNPEKAQDLAVNAREQFIRKFHKDRMITKIRETL